MIVVLIYLSLVISDIKHFLYVYWPLVCPPCTSVYSGPLPINWIAFFLKLNSCINSLDKYILEIIPLSDASVVNMFYHTVGSRFILLMVSFAVQKLFSLMWFHLFIFSFDLLALGDILAKILLCEMSQILLPMFSPRSLMVTIYI